jgi:polysaccharide biosynthesis protein PslE
MLARHKGKAAVGFVVVLLAAIGATAFMQPAYRSEAKLYVRLGRENSMLDPTATIGTGPLVAVPPSREEEINSVSEILRSRVLLESIVEQFGADAILGREIPESTNVAASSALASAAGGSGGMVAPPKVHVAAAAGKLSSFWQRIAPDPAPTPREAALKKLQRRLAVVSPRKSNVISVRYDGPTPELSQAIVTRLLDLYLEKHSQLNRPAETQEFFSDQTEELRRRLRETEEELRSAKDSTGVASITEQQSVLITRIGDLRKRELETAAELAVAAAELASLEERMQKLPEFLEVERVAGHANEAADGMKQQLFSLQLKEQDLLSTFKEETLQIREIRRQIAEAKRILDAEESQRTQVTTGMNRAFEQTRLAILEERTRVAALQARQSLLQRQIAESRGEMERLNRDALRIAQLQRDVDLQDAHFRTYARNLEQARIDQALEMQRISNIGIVQPATLESTPVRPNKLLNLGMGLVAALCVGVGVALLADHFDHTLRTSEDIEERLGVPALVTIPRMGRVSPVTTGSVGT